MYCCVLLCTTHKSGAGREIQQQYRLVVVRVGGSVVRVHKISFFIHESPGGGTAANVPTKIYLVLLCTTNKSGGGQATAGERWICTQQIRQQYSIRVRGSVVVVHKISFFYSRVTPRGGTATNIPTKMYCCCVLLRTTNKSGGRRATAGERCMCAHSKYSSSSILVVRVGRSVVVHIISFFIHESHPEVVLLLMYQQKCTAVYNQQERGGGRARK